MTPKQEHEAQLFRQKALSMKSKSEDKIEMTMTASVGFCALKNKPAFDDISMTFYVRTNTQKDFFTLFKEQDMQFDDKSKKAMIEIPNIAIEGKYLMSTLRGKADIYEVFSL